MTVPTTDPGKISRRKVAHGAAWAVPAILVASAAPAYAVSCGTLDWDKYSGRVLTGDSNVVSGSFTVQSGVSTVVVSIKITRVTGKPFGHRNGTVQSGPQGGIYENWLAIHRKCSREGDTYRVDITTSQPVTGMTFSVLDLDFLDKCCGYDDQLVVGTPGYTANLGSWMVGSGTTSDPYRTSGGSGTTNGTAKTSDASNVRLKWDNTPRSSFTFDYVNGQRTACCSTEIGLSDLHFCT